MGVKKEVLMLASVASMIDQFNMQNIRLLQEMGYEVHAACNFREGNTCDAKRIQKLKKTFAAMHVIWHQWDCPRSVTPLLKCWNAYRQLQKLLKEHAFAWIHCHSPVGGALSRIAARQQGIRVIYTAHGFHFYRGAPLLNWLLYYPVEKLLAGWTDVLITVNREDYQFARRRLGAGRVCYIPGVGIDLERFAAAKQAECCPHRKTGADVTDLGMSVHAATRDERFSKKYHIPQNAAVLLSTGELSKRKNHRAVIAALAALKRQDVYYLICGQGPLRKELLRDAQRLGVGNYIRIPGYQEEMPWIYRNADIFVFPSLQEGMPAALMEAMAAGLPCVVSDIRGNRELVRSSERFSLKHPEELLKLLEHMLEDRRYRQACGYSNQEQVKNYDSSAVKIRMQKIYEIEEAQ